MWVGSFRPMGSEGRGLGRKDVIGDDFKHHSLPYQGMSSWEKVWGGEPWVICFQHTS